MTDTQNPNPSPEDRRALLASLLKKRAGEASFRLSYFQQRLWFLAQLQPGSAVYNVPLAWHIRGPLHVAVLERSLAEVVRRHEILRTVFRSVDGVPRQEVLPELRLELPVVDPRGEVDPWAAVERLMSEEARRPFDLTRGPLLRPMLLRLAPDEHQLLLILHHIICDGGSVGVLTRELTALYEDFGAGRPSSLPELPIQYADFAHWQSRHLRGPVLDELLAFWKGRLQDISSFSGLPTDRPRPPVQTYRGAYLSFDVPSEVLARLEALAHREGGTLFMVLLASFLVLLRRYTGEDEVVVGTPVANRNRVELEQLIGFFTNTLVLRSNLAGDPTFRELLQRVRAEVLAAYAHQELPFEKLVEELHPHRNLAQNPLFQVLVSYREDEEEALRLAGAEVEALGGGTGTAKFDISLSLSRTAGGLRGRLEYSTDLFEATTLERMREQLQTLLAAVAQDPGQRLSALPVQPEAERRRLLVEWNATATSFPRESLLPHLFERQVERTPDAEAVLAGGHSLTYRELNARANQLAHHLRRLGVGPDVPVGIYLERSLEMMVGLLGILKAGGAYLPLDPTYPADRLAFMMEDSHTPVVVTRERLTRSLPAVAARVVSLDGAGLEREGTDNPTALAAPENLAYLIYTSGSTGRPKGVMVTHRNAVNFFTGMDGVLGGEVPGTWLAVTSISFDISVLELLWTLARGFRVVVHPQERALAAPASGPRAIPEAAPQRSMDFSLFYFGGGPGHPGAQHYRLLLEGAKFADRQGFKAVWTPERHFHRFGGLYPNPSVTGAAIAAITERVQVRAGSVVLPLHEPLRVAEEWSVVDNLSQGRVGISFASGWHANDFAFAPDRYAERKRIMLRGIEEVRRLWRGEKVKRRGGAGNDIEVGIFPPPVQRELPTWLTSARHPETFQLAGEIGANLLTHLVGHGLEQLAEKIALYRKAWREQGHPGEGHVTVMLHTFVGQDEEAVREKVRGPLCQYLKTSFDLLASLGQSLAREVDFRDLPEEELDALVRQAFGRFYETAGLLGTPEKCADMVDRLKTLGVDEVACLIDFGVEEEDVLAALEHLARVRELSEERRQRAMSGEDSLADQLERHEVTHLQCTPSLARMLVGDAQAREGLRPLRKLLLGGEALPPALARELVEHVEGELHNMYGPTETTVWSTTHRVEPAEGAVPIGHPIANTRTYLVDRHLQLVPTGMPGELLIGGEGVVRGYLHQPALTAERFVPDPFSGEPGQRLYRTGDLARHRASGELEFLGRLDHQVKIRGHRIELGEIEAVLVRYPGIQSAAVVARGEGADTRLVAYCVAAPGTPADLSTGALRAWLGKALPEYMLPAAFVVLDSLPLTPNGKVDRKALPDPEGARPSLGAPFKPPESHLERTIAEVWKEVLKVTEVGIDDNFFELGGNSLLIVQVRTRLLAKVEGNLSLVDMFKHPTVRALAAALAGHPSSEAALESVRDQAGKRKEAVMRQARLRKNRRAR